MATANFWSMDNFDLWATSSDRFCTKVCPECNCGGMEGDICECCGADLSDVPAEFDELSEMLFYEDMITDLEAENENLQFHEITLKSGYYDGVQLYVESLHYVEEYDNDETRYHFDLCRSAAIRKYHAEQRRIEKILEKLARAYGLDKLAVYAFFSNGETMYVKEAAGS